MRNAFIDTLLDECRRRDDVIILSGDAGLGVFDRFREEFPDRFINTGVAEQNALGFAAGLAMTGWRVVVYNIIPFVAYRCYEQLRNDICCQRLPVIIAGIGSGITYAPMGMSHYSVEDLGLIQTLPNLTTISPIDPVEARAAARFALECDGPVYVRLAKRGEPDYSATETFDISCPRVIREGEGTAIVFHGSISREVMAAYDLLTLQGVPPRLVSVAMVQPLDADVLLAACGDVRRVISVEEHYAHCGLGGMLARLAVERRVPWQLTMMGIPPHFIHDIGSTEHLRTRCGISAGHIAAAVTEGGR